MASVTTDVAIVGGGPSGLTLGLSLGRYGIKSVILEREEDITQDPRGVVLTGDAVRSLCALGLGDCMPLIGHELQSLDFHTTSPQNEPFFKVNLESDMMDHALPSTMLQSQPKLEYFLRKLVSSSTYCTLQSACEVVGRDEDAEGVTVHYLNRDRPHQIRAKWLVGADGKRGIVRKHFLEASAGIRQEVGIFEYEGTWVAANLEITLPTPESHPELALWAAGHDPESVYDLYWPKNWHFCRPPGKPVACGRFGPFSDRLWRHEFAVPEWNDSMDALAMFWEHLTPIITRKIEVSPGAAPVDVTFPRDCIRILRCRPFRFSHRVVNRWFSNRTILIGDAAHVFPPFGGQGVACGVQDAVGLAWRLALLTKDASLSSSTTSRETVLQAWANERRMGIDNSARLTRQNGELCNEEATLMRNAQLAGMKIGQAVLSKLRMRLPAIHTDSQGYRGCDGGAFLPAFHGGIKLGQIYVQTRVPGSPALKIELSDRAWQRVPTILTLLVIQSTPNSEPEKSLADLVRLLRQSGINSAMLSEKSIVLLDAEGSLDLEESVSRWTLCRAAPTDLLAGFPLRSGYSPQQFLRRLGDASARYIIVRPDNIVYAIARDLQGLGKCLTHLEESFS